MFKLLRDRRALDQATLLASVLGWWVITGLALADTELWNYAFLGGAKALFVGIGILLTLWLARRLWRLSGDD